jgi:quinol monooxygenase YgiN
MVCLVINVTVLTGKRNEFIQTMDFLLKQFRLEDGCINYGLESHQTEKNQISIRAEWDSWPKLEVHFRGGLFTIFLGAINVLCETVEVKIKVNSELLAMEAIEKARKKVDAL